MKILFTALFFLYASMPPDRPCDVVPELNRQVVAFVKSRLNTRMGREECWDLAAEALNSINAKWDKRYAFGREVNHRTECVYPGDIMQFESVKVKYQKDGYFYEDIMDHHTAVIYEVKSAGCFIMAEQNTSLSGKVVTLNPLNLQNIVKGRYRIYRPVASIHD